MSKINSIKSKKNEPIDPNHKRKAFITFVVDESGSMNSGRDATINGMNEQIQMIRKKFKDATTVTPVVSVIKFNNEVIPLFINKTLDELIEFTTKTYNPNGGTAMYDAVGYALNQLGGAEGINDEDSTVLVVVVSDGEENSSKEHTSKMIADRVMTLNETKRWTFVYLGANQDLSVVSGTINFVYGNTRSFDSSNEITYADAFRGHNKAFINYVSNVSASTLHTMSTVNFYDAPEKQKSDVETFGASSNGKLSETKP